MNGGNHGNPGEIQDEQLKKETSKRRASLEQRIKERSSSASSSMSTSSNSSSEGNALNFCAESQFLGIKFKFFKTNKVLLN